MSGNSKEKIEMAQENEGKIEKELFLARVRVAGGLVGILIVVSLCLIVNRHQVILAAMSYPLTLLTYGAWTWSSIKLKQRK